MTSKQEAAEEAVDKALSIAAAVENVLVGHYAVSVLMALGWVLGAYAADQGSHDGVLEDALDIVGREAKRKFDGVLDGSWGNAS